MGFINDLLGGGSKQKTETTVKQPPYVEAAGKKAVDLAGQIAEQPYQAYTGPRIARLAPNQVRANKAATGGFLKPQKMIDAGYRLARDVGGREFSTADANRFMNPFVESALNPAIRRLNEEAQQNAIGRRAGMVGQGGVGAFGDARTAVLEGELEEARLRGIGDITSTGYANAYDRALQEWGAQGDRQLRAADLMGTQGGRRRATTSAGIQDLLSTGGVQQAQRQRPLDLAYGDFLEQRDWPQRGLDAYIRALSGVPFARSETTSGNTGPSAAQSAVGLGLAGAGIWNLFS